MWEERVGELGEVCVEDNRYNTHYVSMYIKKMHNRRYAYLGRGI